MIDYEQKYKSEPTCRDENGNTYRIVFVDFENKKVGTWNRIENETLLIDQRKWDGMAFYCHICELWLPFEEMYALTPVLICKRSQKALQEALLWQ